MVPVDLLIDDANPRGFGLARCPSGKGRIEVAHAIPGDRVRVELSRRRQRVKKGRLVELLDPSPDRVEPRCAHASICGGCSWQAMDYQAQLLRKQNGLREAFGGLLAEGTLRPIIPCENPWEYRNKMEFSFSENRAGAKFLGLMIAHAEPFVFNVERCHIAPPWMSEVLARVREWRLETGLSAYYPPEDRGTLRYLTLRQAMRTGQKLAILNVSGNPAFAPAREHLDRFARLFDEEVGVFLRVHQASKGAPTRFYEWHLKGPDHIIEEMRLEGGVLQFKISPSSFFQPHTEQAEKLYDEAVRCLGEGRRVVYDLYCGTGTLGMAAVRRADAVVGIELSPEAVLDAEANAARNGISNIRFYRGDVGKVLTAQTELPRPDAVIVDPPRAGLDPLALHHLIRLSPERIVYVSCNPLTQADNIRELAKAGYALESLQGIDQFPHTAHVESVAGLVRMQVLS